MTTTPTLLEQLAQEVLALRAELAGLREQLATEVRTRRLVVEHESGFESIVAVADHDAAQISVVARTDPETFVRLHMTERDRGGDGVFGGVYLSGGGTGVGMFAVDQGDGDRNSIVYGARLDVVEERGPGRISLDVDGLQIRR